MAFPVSYIQCIGQLGNQLFEIAAAYAHALRNGATLRLSDTLHYGEDSFLHKCAAFVGPPPDNVPVVPEPHFHYAPIPDHAQWLHGYYQSSKYFADMKPAVLDLLDAHPRVKAAVAEKYASYLQNDDYADAVVVHVRRGDYVTFPRIHDILTPLYFRAAMETFRNTTGIDCKFLVFSDDIAYCREVFGNDANVECIDEPNVTFALHVMSQFKHYIVSNSSFSWWATYLGTPATTVIAPHPWFGPDGPPDFEDIYEPDWIRLPAQ